MPKTAKPASPAVPAEALAPALSPSTIEMIALAGIKAPEDAKRELAPGVYPIDCTVRVRGAVKREADTEAVIAAAVPWERLFAVALSKLNGATLDALIREADELTPEAMDEVTSRAKKAVAALKEATKTKRAGATKITVVVERLPDSE